MSVSPHMWETSNRLACARQCWVESMMESPYWMGMDQPAKGTILPERENEGRLSERVRKKKAWEKNEAWVSLFGAVGGTLTPPHFKCEWHQGGRH